MEDFAFAKVSPNAVDLQKALKAYTDLIAERNAHKVQYNLALKKLVVLSAQVKLLKERATSAQDEVFSRPDATQLAQMAEMAQTIYCWNRARPMRFLSLYRRAIWLARLAEPRASSLSAVHASATMGDTILTLSAPQILEMYQDLKTELWRLYSSASSGPSLFLPTTATDRGKYVELTGEQVTALLRYKQLRITLPAPSPNHSTLPFFRGIADVRIYYVRFWLEGLTVRPTAVTGKAIPVIINLTHEGDSTFYDPKGTQHDFVHDPVDILFSY